MYTSYIYHKTSCFHKQFLAQSVEHQTFNREVRGSNPSTGVTFLLFYEPNQERQSQTALVERKNDIVIYRFIRCMETHLASVDHILMSVRCQMSDGNNTVPNYDTKY